MLDLIAALLMMLGAAFVLVAAIGLLRFPDVLMRMHATTKAGTLGVGLIAVSVMFAFGDVEVVTRSAGIILFIVLTAPISAHMISRATYIAEVELWEGTFVDELREHQLRDEADEEDDR